jgi:MFS transporter, OFA family, oxalate/formate antiporter
MHFKDNNSYGWVIVAAFFVVSTIIFGELTSFGVFFKSIEVEFGLSRAATSSIFSIQNLFAAIMSFVGGWVIEKYGPKLTTLIIGSFTGLSLLLTSQTTSYWQLFISYSLLFSVIGIVYTLIMSTVSRWFVINRGLALGISGTGIGLGAVIFAPVSSFLISSYNWRTAYIILGLFTLIVVIPLSQLLRKNSSEINSNNGTKKYSHSTSDSARSRNRDKIKSTEFSLGKAFRTRSFWLIGIIWLLNALCYFLVLIHIVPYATDMSLTPIEASLVLSLIGLSYVAGRLLMGRVSDTFGIKKTAIFSALLAALSMIWLIYSKDLRMLYVFGFIFGFANGGLDPCMAALVSETFGIRKIGIIMGTLQVYWGIGVFAGPALGGLLFDINHSYLLAFVIGILSMFSVAILTVFTKNEISLATYEKV